MRSRLTELRRRTKKITKSLSVTPTTGFMSLPAELRNDIYHLALIEEQVVYIRPSKRGYWAKQPYNLPQPKLTPWREPGLLRANKTIRAEASSLYYKSNSFDLALQLSDTKRATGWLRHIIQRCGNDPFKHFTFFVRNSFWADLHHARDLAAFFHIKDLHLAPRPEQTSLENAERPIRVLPPERHDLAGDVIRMDDPDRFSFRIALERAIKMGRTAKREAWSEEWLDYEFGVWLDKTLSKGDALRATRASKARQIRKREELSV